MVKMNKMIEKKTGGIFLVIYVNNGGFVYRYYKNTVCIQGGSLSLSRYVFDNQNWLPFVCFVQLNNQLDPHQVIVL